MSHLELVDECIHGETHDHPIGEDVWTPEGRMGERCPGGVRRRVEHLSGILIQSEWRYNTRFWTVAIMDADVDGAINGRYWIVGESDQ